MRRILLIYIVLFVIQGNANSSADDLIVEAYREYSTASLDYIKTLRESSNHIRSWRKKKLLEIFDERLVNLEKNLTLSNTSLINEFDKFIKENSIQSLDDVLLIRLAQLQFEKANLEYNAQMKSYQKQIDRLGNNSNIEYPAMPVPDYSETLKYLSVFLKSFPKSTIKDKALYLAGFCNEELRNIKSASSYYRKLITEVPNSEYAEEVRWRLAESDYSAKKLESALQGYISLARIKGAFYTKALYKQGATLFALNRFNESAQIFERILNELKKINSLSTEDQIIQDEAIEYLATIFTQDTSVVISNDLMPEVLYRLGQMYKKRLDEKSLAGVYSYATQKYPLSYRLPEMYADLIEKFESENDIERANSHRNKMIQNLQNQKWWVANEKYRNIIFQAQDLLEFNLLKSAEYHANRGYRNNNPDELKIARDRYFNFITKYPWSPYAGRAKLELADIEYFVQNYEVSSKYYFEIVNETNSASIREEAAYSLIWSEVKKVRYDLNFEDKNFNVNLVNKTPFTKQENVFIQAALFYVSKIKYSSRRNKVLYKLAEMYLEHADFDTSANYLNMIVSDSLNTNIVTIRAFRLLNEIYNLKGDWKSLSVVQELSRSMNFYVDIGVLDKNNLIQKNLEKLETAINYEFEGRYEQSAKEFEKVLFLSKNADLNEILIAKLANLFLKTGEFKKANDYIIKLSQTNLKIESEFLKAQLLFKQVNFDEAANAFENFIAQNPKHQWYEEAYLNVISIRSQLKQPQKIGQFFSKNKPSEQSVYLYYEYWDSLVKSKQFEEVLRSIGQLRVVTNYDYYRLQSYLLQAYAYKDDYLNFGRKCTSLKSSIISSKHKTSYSVFIESFCEYFDLKKIIAKSETTLNEIVSGLNKVYSYQIDFITLKALNEIIVSSDLKNTNRKQFEQLAHRGWTLAKQNPMNSETFEFTKNIINHFNIFPLSLSYMMNWNSSLSEMFEFQNTTINKEQWRVAKNNCDIKNYSSCLKDLKALFASDYSEELAQNILLAALKMGDDKELNQAVRSFIEKSNFSELSKIYAYLLGMPMLIPEDKRSIEVNTQSPLSLTAKAIELYESDKPGESLSLLRDAVLRFPHSPYPYYILSQIYFEMGLPELSRTVVLNGYEATHSKGLLPILYQLNAVTFSNTRVNDENISIDTTSAEYFGLAFAAIKNNDTKMLSRIYNELKTMKNWFDMTKSLELLYVNTNSFRADINENNNYILWLSKLYALSRTQSVVDLENLKRLADFGIRNPSYKEIEKALVVREIAGDERK